MLFGLALGCGLRDLPREVDALRAGHAAPVGGAPGLGAAAPEVAEHPSASVIEQPAPAGRVAAPVAGGEALQLARLELGGSVAEGGQDRRAELIDGIRRAMPPPVGGGTHGIHAVDAHGRPSIRCSTFSTASSWVNSRSQAPRLRM